MQLNHREVIGAILLGGIIAATIDIGAAALINSRSPVFIMQAIAGGVLGRATFQGGAGSAILGALLQEFMGILIAAIYVVLSKTVPALTRRWVLSGLIYGVIIYFVMNYVVVPLSALKAMPHFKPVKFAEDMIAMLIFGLIIAFFARRRVSAPAAAQNQAAPAT